MINKTKSIKKILKLALMLNIAVLPIQGCQYVKIALDVLQICETLKICGDKPTDSNKPLPSIQPTSYEGTSTGTYQNLPLQETTLIDFKGTWCINTRWGSGHRYEGTLNITNKESNNAYSGTMSLNSTYDPENISHSVTQNVQLIIRADNFELSGSNAYATDSNNNQLKYEPDYYNLTIYSDSNFFEGSGTDSTSDKSTITMKRCN